MGVPIEFIASNLTLPDSDSRNPLVNGKLDNGSARKQNNETQEKAKKIDTGAVSYVKPIKAK